MLPVLEVCLCLLPRACGRARTLCCGDCVPIGAQAVLLLLCLSASCRALLGNEAMGGGKCHRWFWLYTGGGGREGMGFFLGGGGGGAVDFFSGGGVNHKGGVDLLVGGAGLTHLIVCSEGPGSGTLGFLG